MKCLLGKPIAAANLDFAPSFPDIPEVDAQLRAHSAARLFALPRKQTI
jgi:hypothetical protein